MVSLRYLLNQLMDYDQTCIGTLLREGKRVDEILVTLTLFSTSQGHFELLNFDENMFCYDIP